MLKKPEVLEVVPSPPNTLDSGYEYEPEITIRKEGKKELKNIGLMVIYTISK